MARAEFKPTKDVVACKLITADYTNATTGLTATLLSVPLIAYATYEIEAFLVGGRTADANGVVLQLLFSGTATIEAVMTAALTSAAGIVERIAAFSADTTAVLTTASQAGGILIKGIVTTTVKGNLSISAKSPTAGTTTIRIGSFLKATRID